jgi:hypothetical protein
VNVITAANLRRLIPASAVAAVLAFSWLGPLPSLASNGGTGYNCGVKGIGYKVNGKACPNRPFPGQGKGITKFTGTSPVESVGATTLSTSTATTSEVGGDNSATGKGHGNGHAKSNGHGHGHGKG